MANPCTTDSSWLRKSQMTVRAADLCVFVIVEKYGEITWNAELQLTTVSFTHATFSNILRRQLATQFHLTLQGQQERNRRAATARLVVEGARLNHEERTVGRPGMLRPR